MRAIIIAVLVLIAAPAFADECNTSANVSTAMAQFGGAEKAHLTGREARDFLDAVAAFTGEARAEDEVMIFVKEGMAARVVLFKSGCATVGGDFPVDLVTAWLGVDS